MSAHYFLLYNLDGTVYADRDICFADDLQSFEATLENLQRMADLVSTYAIVRKLALSQTSGVPPPRTPSS